MHDLIYIIGPNEAQWEAIKALQSKNTTAKNNKKAHHLWEIDVKPHPKSGMHFFQKCRIHPISRVNPATRSRIHPRSRVNPAVLKILGESCLVANPVFFVVLVLVCECHRAMHAQPETPRSYT